MVLAQVGSPSIGPKRSMAADRVEETPAYIRKVARNLIAWGESNRPLSDYHRNEWVSMKQYLTKSSVAC